MDDKTKKRIYMFYTAGVVNLLIGAYILSFGRDCLPEDKITMLIRFLLGFAALDFWMPVMMKKKAKRASWATTIISWPPRTIFSPWVRKFS